MKLVNYQLQTQIEYLSEDKPNNFFKEYLQSILEDTSKPYYQRADYIGLSLNQIKNRYSLIWYIWTSSFKEKLSNALEIASITIVSKIRLWLATVYYLEININD